MSREQIREGFHRIGEVMGWITGAICSLVIFGITQPLAASGSWWNTAYWLAIVVPASIWCGFLPARIIGWIVEGFANPDEQNVQPP